MFGRVVRRAERFGGDRSAGARVRLALLRLRYVLLLTAGACTATALYVLLAIGVLGL